MKRVVIHWTAGTNAVSAIDRQHYHRIIDGEGSIFAGVWPIEANEHIDPKGPVTYAAHTLNANTGSIGVALCGMEGAIEAPFSAGLYPINALQLRAAAQVVADLCAQYGIPVMPRTVLTHAEVQPTLGIAQRGKWDIKRLPWRPDLIGARQVGDHIRALVLEEARPRPAPAPAPIPVIALGDANPAPRPSLLARLLAFLFPRKL